MSAARSPKPVAHFPGGLGCVRRVFVDERKAAKATEATEDRLEMRDCGQPLHGSGEYCRQHGTALLAQLYETRRDLRLKLQNNLRRIEELRAAGYPEPPGEIPP